ncbi:fungal-specific transcription factor domain-containing protein [Xylariaceae sp. FL1019]|nr:fungal-specific transcription factor domain-containing protein [Xylariaceae sp. FL1019]
MATLVNLNMDNINANDDPLPTPKQIRFINNQGQPPTKRRRINAACLTCRKRKTRCAGEQPTCSTCENNGHVCLGYSDVVEKRKAGHLDDGAEHYPDGDPEHDLRRSREPNSTLVSNNSGSGNVDVGAGGLNGNDDASGTLSSRTSNTPRDYATPLLPHKTEAVDWEDARSQKSQTTPRRDAMSSRPTNPRNTSFSTEDGRSPNSRSPVMHHNENGQRVPYFRYFGPTAIVPGFKQMVVKVNDKRRSSMSATSPSVGSIAAGLLSTTQPDVDLGNIEDIPVYDINDPSPVHPLILSLVETFFLRLGCNYPFLNRHKFPQLVMEKRVEPILVDAVCALAARFSDVSLFRTWNDGKLAKSEYGHVWAQRAKAATVDTFACPSVAAVQACLLMAYDGFGADQDSALWMYLGVAIRMAIDLGLSKEDGVKYHGPKDPWPTRWIDRRLDESHQDRPDGDEPSVAVGPEEQREIEQERIDTFWAVFFLDRAISSGTGRPVTLRADDFDLGLPRSRVKHESQWPDPYASLLHIIHLYGRVSDVLNNIKEPKDLTKDKLNRLVGMENELTRLHQKMDPRLRFDANNFQAHVKNTHGTTFILLHFWFHALIIVLHQPTLLTSKGTVDRKHQLKAHSRELSMSSAKTIADILAFAELLDPRCFIGNPFTSQPIYIAACAFLLESKVSTPQPDARMVSPPPGLKNQGPHPGDPNSTSSKHLLLASAALQNYQLCYKALKQMHAYWGGVRYILNVLDQKSHGEEDCETFTTEEYESTRRSRRDSLTPRFSTKSTDFPASPMPESGPPLAWSLTGTTNSPNSSLTLLFHTQGNAGTVTSHHAGSLQQVVPQSQPQQASSPATAPTPPGNMIYDPIRQSLPETSMYPPAYPQPNTSALRHSVRSPNASSRSRGPIRFSGMNQDDGMPATSDNTKMGVTSRVGPVLSSMPFPQTSSSGFEPQGSYLTTTSSSTSTPSQTLGTNGHAVPGAYATAADGLYSFVGAPGYDLHLLTYDNETDIGQHLSSFEHTDMMSWCGDYFPNDVFGLYSGVDSM